MASISILLPTYEPNPSHLREAIESVLAQTISDWDLLIHDDASTVDVRSMIEQFLSDSRIRFVRSDRRLGIGGNWNACVRQTNGEFVQFLFQDDRWTAAYLERALAIMKDQRIGFVMTHHRYVFDGPIDADRRRFYEEIERKRMQECPPGQMDRTHFLQRWITLGLRPNLIGEPSFVLLRRSLMKAVGPFREDLPQGLDEEYWLRCLTRSDVAFIPEHGGDFRIHAAAASARNDAQGHGLTDRLACFDTLLRELPQGELRSLTAKTLSEEFEKMVRKFWNRKKDGGTVGGAGISTVLRMAIKHPLLLVKGFFRGQKKKIES